MASILLDGGKMIFGCKHPFNKLDVRKGYTEENIDQDFDRVIMHFKCIKCGKDLDIKYAAMIGGVKAFLARPTKMKGI